LLSTSNIADLEDGYFEGVDNDTFESFAGDGFGEEEGELGMGEGGVGLDLVGVDFMRVELGGGVDLKNISEELIGVGREGVLRIIRWLQFALAFGARTRLSGFCEKRHAYRWSRD
jgi:hypothetical protein